jgi:hypothetical protein
MSTNEMTASPRNTDDQIVRRGSWVSYLERSPVKPGMYFTISEHDEPEITHWNGDAFDYMGGHTDVIVKWWEPNTSVEGRKPDPTGET